jgi:P-type conjugative transfer protein TrbG
MRAELAAVCLLAGCAAIGQSQPAPVAPVAVAEPQPATPPPSPKQILAQYPALVREAIKDHQADHDWPHFDQHQRMLFPYSDDSDPPVITCRQLRSTDIALEPGETITDAALGDSAAWAAEFASSGSPANPTPHVSIKCQVPGRSTSLTIYTTRRTYRFHLRAVNRGAMQLVEFYYPDDILARLAAPAPADVAQNSAMPDPDNLDFDYAISGPDVPWHPIRAFSDDKRRVFIQMPAAMASDEAPALMLDGAAGPQMVNYRVRGNYYIVDRLFTRAELVSGVGRQQDAVVIQYTGNAR